MAVYLVFTFIVTIIYLLYYMLFKNHNYWRDRNVPYVKPLPLFGNYKDHLLLKRHVVQIAQDLCERFPNEPYVGTFFGTDPALIVKDPTLLKLVLAKDFYYVNGREISDYKDKEMMGRNMFFATGDEWKVLRTNLTPLFSSVKLKNMFYLIKNSSDRLGSVLEEEIKKDPHLEVRSLLSKYTIECISACAFGVRADALKSDGGTNAFSNVGNKIFHMTDFRARKAVCRTMWPSLFYGLGFKLFDDEIGQFFNNIILGVFKKREGTNIARHDFVDLILTWRKSKVISGDSLGNIKTGDKKIVNIDVNDDLLLSQCMLFFAAGFETTSTSTSFLLYELAKDKVSQDKVIEEVDEYFAKHKDIEFEAINCMPFTEMCLEESLRLYPVLGLLTREVMHEYVLPTGLRLKKGDRVHIPVHHIQRNPNYFTDPEVYRPTRFSPEEKKNIKPFTYMPFGEGPRACIGMRFAKMPIYAALLKIFKNYKLETYEKTPKQVFLDPKITLSQPDRNIYLKFVPRKGN